MIIDEKLIMTPKELEDKKKEAVKQYKISLFNEIDYYLNNMISDYYDVEQQETNKKVYYKDDIKNMIQQMKFFEF